MEDTNHNVLCVDPRQALNYGSDIYEIEKSAQTVSYYKQAANTVSNSQLSWNIQVPSKSVLLDRKVFIECGATVKLRGYRPVGGRILTTVTNDYRPSANLPSVDNVAASNLYINNPAMPFCMRGNPLSKACDALTVTINGMSITTKISDYSSIFDNVNLWDPDAYRFIHSAAWGRGDASQREIECGVNLPDTNVSPFGGFSGTSNTITKRDDQTRYFIISNPQSTDEAVETEAVIYVKWFEQVMVGPLSQALSKSDSKALAGINQLQLVYALSNIERMILVQKPSNATNDALAISSVNVNLVDSALHLCYLTPTSVMGSLPPRLLYNTKLMVNYPTGIENVTRQTISNISQGNIQLSSIPKYLVIFVSKVPNTNLTADVSAGNNRYNCYSTVYDGCASITNISITFNNVTGLLSTASPNDMYNMSSRNGYCGTYDDFIKHKGSKFCCQQEALKGCNLLVY